MCPPLTADPECCRGISLLWWGTNWRESRKWSITSLKLFRSCHQSHRVTFETLRNIVFNQILTLTSSNTARNLGVFSICILNKYVGLISSVGALVADYLLIIRPFQIQISPNSQSYIYQHRRDKLDIIIKQRDTTVWLSFSPQSRRMNVRVLATLNGPWSLMVVCLSRDLSRESGLWWLG